MVFLLLVSLFPWPLDHELLAVEDARREAEPLVAALASSEPAIVGQAVRALGRFERPQLAAAVLPILSSPEVDLRIEAANALAQMQSEEKLAPYLENEREHPVRAALFEAIGRLPEASEALLLPGLEEDETVRFGAMKGLESFYRRNERRPSEEALASIRRAVRDSRSPGTRKLALLALLRAEDSGREAFEAAFEDPDPGVRRLAVAGLKEWREDPSYLVRYEALRAAPLDCARAAASLSDPSEHVVLLAIDRMGKGCPPEPLETILSEPQGWRRTSRALVSLGSSHPDKARPHLARFVEHEVWQARAYAAKAAKLLGESEALAKLRTDRQANVVAEALVSPGDAVAALASDDYGLLMTAASLMEGWEEGPSAVPALLETLFRVTSQKKHTSRDPRRSMLERIREFGDASAARRLEPLLSDFDPAIAALAAEILTEKTGRRYAPQTKHFAPDLLPARELLLGLKGARAVFRMKEAGSFTVELLPEVAPLTVARVVELAESGYYGGLTFHRIVPNFVLQGGSPGANEYVGTAGYLRDEVSTLSHQRGTLGISTRGRDTGDSQIFINLVDNFRLDHHYTVFARVVEGMQSVDAIQEGDAIESVTIERAR